MGFLSSFFGTNRIRDRRKELQLECSRFAHNRNRLKSMAKMLYYYRKSNVEMLVSLSDKLSEIDNLPYWGLEDFRKSLDKIKDFQMAVKYESSPLQFARLTDETGRTAKIIDSAENTSTAITEIGSITMMAIATVMGTVSTGTSISARTGLAATNAALAWLVGGVYTAGGIAVGAGSLLLGLFRPMGMTIAGLGTVGSLLSGIFTDEDEIEDIENQLGQIIHDNETIEPKLAHLSDLISRSRNNYKSRLQPSVKWLEDVCPKDYKQWDDNQKRKFEKLINAVSNTVQLINERV